MRPAGSDGTTVRRSRYRCADAIDHRPSIHPDEVAIAVAPSTDVAFGYAESRRRRAFLEASATDIRSNAGAGAPEPHRSRSSVTNRVTKAGIRPRALASRPRRESSSSPLTDRPPTIEGRSPMFREARSDEDVARRRVHPDRPGAPARRRRVRDRERWCAPANRCSWARTPRSHRGGDHGTCRIRLDARGRPRRTAAASGGVGDPACGQEVRSAGKREAAPDRGARHGTVPGRRANRRVPSGCRAGGRYPTCPGVPSPGAMGEATVVRLRGASALHRTRRDHDQAVPPAIARRRD